MATLKSEDSRVGGNLVVSREPVPPKNAGSKGSLGDQAVMDAVIIVAIAWAVLLFLAFTLRNHNI